MPKNSARHMSAAATLDASVAPIPEPLTSSERKRHPRVSPLEDFHKLPAACHEELFADIEKAAKSRDLDRLLDKLSDWAAASEYYVEPDDDEVIIGHDPATGDPIYDWPRNPGRPTAMASMSALDGVWNTPEEDEAWSDL